MTPLSKPETSSCLLLTTFNRTGQLRHTLERLCERTLPDEILVVDDGGHDGAGNLVQEFSDRLPVRYLYHFHPGQTLCSEARNIGIKNTDAEIIITSEPEVMFVTDVIAQLLARHAENQVDVISAGAVYHAQQEGTRDPGQCQKILGWVATFTALYRRDWLIEVGGWDETFPGNWGFDDTDLLTRLRCAGHGQVIDLEIEILHQWHGSSATNHAPNEQHFLGKNLQHDDSRVVANRGSEWGVIRST